MAGAWVPSARPGGAPRMRSAARSRSGGGGDGEMAAAGLAAPEGGSAVMPLGTAVATAAAVCPPPAGPGSWSRSLDRALEEAAASGTLSLSGRKLRDYPRASAANHDLSDTTQAGFVHSNEIQLAVWLCNQQRWCEGGDDDEASEELFPSVVLPAQIG